MVQIIFKCDDFQEVSDNVLVFDKIVCKKHIKASWGIIGHSVKYMSEQCRTWVKEQNKSNRYEFWNHGFSHDCKLYEFQKSLFKQYMSIMKTNKQCKKVLDLKLQCFGAPANHINKNTALALLFCNQIKAWFYGEKNYKQHIFKRSIEVEFPCGHVVYEKFKHAYEKWGFDQNLIIYQLHPNMWNQKDFEEFELVVDFLKARNAEFLLPKEIYLQNKNGE